MSFKTIFENKVISKKSEYSKSSFDDKARIFLLVDLREFFFRFRVGGTKKNKKKTLKMTS